MSNQDKDNSEMMKRLQAMSPEEQQKLLADTMVSFSINQSTTDTAEWMKHFTDKPIDLSEVGAPVFKQRSVSTPPYEAHSEPFEIPRDENGKIDIAKLPEEIRDTIQLVSELFDESTAESEQIIEQMIKVARMNTGSFPEFPFDLPLIHERNRQLLGPDRDKAEMFDFSRPLRHQAIINVLSGGEKKHYGVLSAGDQPQQGYRNMPNKSVGESEYIRPEDRAGLLSGYSPEEQMGLKLPDDLAARLTERRGLLTDFLESSGDKYGPRGEISDNDKDMFKQPVQQGYGDGMKSLVERSRESEVEPSHELLIKGILEVPTGFGHIDKMIEGGLLPEDLVVFGSKTPVSPASVFAPIFDRARAQRQLYKSLITRFNEELNKGPLAGYVWITGARRVPNMLNNYEPVTFEYGHGKGTYRVSNRMFAYSTYFANLHKKYTQEILDAETKVMERE